MKIGGSVITRKREGVVEIRRELLREIVSLLPGDAILVHGAGSYALPAMKHRGTPRFFSALRKMQLRMAHDLVEAISDIALPFYVDAGSGINPGVLAKLREKGYLPVTGAAVTPEPSILSGDDVALQLARSLGERLVFLTDVPGILDENGRMLPEVSSAEAVPDLGHRAFDPTGGMKEKVRKIFRYGVNAVVLSGLDLENLRRFLNGLPFRGTVVRGSLP